MTQLDPAAITSTPGKQVSSVSPQTLHNPSPPQSSLQQQWFSGEHGKMAQDTSENEATTVDLTRQDDHQEEADRPDSPIQQGAVDQPTLPESEDVQMNTNGQLPPELTQEGLFIQAMTRLTSVIRNLECLGGSADFPLSRDCYEFNHETKENQLSQVGVLVMTCQMANHYLYQYLRRQNNQAKAEVLAAASRSHGHPEPSRQTLPAGQAASPGQAAYPGQAASPGPAASPGQATTPSQGPPDHIVVPAAQLRELYAARGVPPGYVVVPAARLRELEEDSRDFLTHLGQFEQHYTDKVLKLLEELTQKGTATGKPRGRPRKRTASGSIVQAPKPTPESGALN